MSSFQVTIEQFSCDQGSVTDCIKDIVESLAVLWNTDVCAGPNTPVNELGYK